MDLKLNVQKRGLSTTEEVINEEYTLRYGHIFRGPKGDSGEKGEKGDNGVSPKISDNGTWLVFSDELKTYVDTGIKASGSDNNYTDADKALVQTIPNKADKEGYYPNMSVGIADDVKNGNTKYLAATPSGDPMHYQYLRAFPINVNTPRGLQYNEATDRWSYMAQYGGITDLTTEEVATIFARSGSGMSDADNNSGKYYQYKMRTNFIAQPIVDSGWGYVSPTLHYLYLQSDIEVAVISPYGPNSSCTPKAAAGMFFECEKLRRVIGKLNLQYTTPTEMFKLCFLLEDINIENLKTNISFADSPLLSKESLLYMIENCAEGVSFTITLHPDVSDKCLTEWLEEIDKALGFAESVKNTNITLARA